MRKIVFTFALIAIISIPTSAQDYNELQFKYSDDLKAGMEFEWVLSKFSYENTTAALGLHQNSNVTDQQTTTTASTIYSTTTAYTSYTTYSSYSVETTTYGAYEEPDYSEIHAGLRIKLMILKDPSEINLTTYYDFAPIDEYELFFDEFFDVSYSQGTEEAMKNFIPLSILITPNTLVYENGTTKDYYQYQNDQYRHYRELYSEYNNTLGNSEEFTIDDGVAIRKIRSIYEEETSFVEFRYDMNTGILIYVYAKAEGTENPDIELEIKLDQVDDNINIELANDDPTLSIPLSTYFVYALILVPIVVNKLKNRSFE